MKIGEACNRDVVCIEADASVGTAARLMREYHVGDLVITRQRGSIRVPAGIITDRDLVLEVLATDLDIVSVTVGDLFASSELVTASVDEETETVIDRMLARGIRRIPVIGKEGQLAGIITMDDILELISEQLSGVVRLVTRQQDLEALRRIP